MDDKNPIQKQNSTPQPVPENSVTSDELSLPALMKPLLEEHSHEKEIDLNALFPHADTNLNNLFPDLEIKHLLKSITKNKKDMSAIKDRLTTENETPDEDKRADGHSPCSDKL